MEAVASTDEPSRDSDSSDVLSSVVGCTHKHIHSHTQTQRHSTQRHDFTLLSLILVPATCCEAASRLSRGCHALCVSSLFLSFFIPCLVALYDEGFYVFCVCVCVGVVVMRIASSGSVNATQECYTQGTLLFIASRRCHIVWGACVCVCGAIFQSQCSSEFNIDGLLLLMLPGLAG